MSDGVPELRMYSCCTSCALILGIIAVSLNVLSVQEAINDQNENFVLIYRSDSIQYDICVQEDNGKNCYQATYTYDELLEQTITFEVLGTEINICDYAQQEGGTTADICTGLEAISDGGEMYMQLAIAAMAILGVANILQCVWGFSPSLCPKCIHWVIAVGCFVSMALFWSSYAAWQTNFDPDNNAAVSNAGWILATAGFANSGIDGNYTVYAARLAVSSIMMILCGCCALLASCFGCFFSYKVQTNAVIMSGQPLQSIAVPGGAAQPTVVQLPEEGTAGKEQP